METHSSILAWAIPWTEEPGQLHFMGSQRVGHDLAIPVSPCWGSFFLSATFLTTDFLCFPHTQVGRCEKHFLVIPLREPSIIFTKHTRIWRSKVISKVTYNGVEIAVLKSKREWVHSDLLIKDKDNVYKKCSSCKTILKLPVPSTRGIRHAKCPNCKKRLTIFTLKRQKVQVIKKRKH